MKIFRIAKIKYIEDLSGLGAELYGGRWNEVGNPMLYGSTHLSLSVLELLANQSWQLIQQGYSFLELELPDQLTLSRIKIEDLPQAWRNNPYHPYTISAGSNWLEQKKTVGMLVPSAVLPQEYNVILNPTHEEFSKVIVRKVGALQLDPRMSKFSERQLPPYP